ncbi:MAG: hypothetical protein ACE5F1_08485 [Planctomycetota bacterium]
MHRSGPGEDDYLLKVFPRDQTALLEREAQALTVAEGRGAPALLGRGVDDATGKPYLKIAWVGETDLRMLVCRDGPLPSPFVLDVARQTARILVTLHALPLVHGDLKPGNLVRDSNGTLHLIDFENAATPAPEDTLMEGFSGGTHGFAPPEAYLGSPPDIAFDLYGLGATLHFLLTGSLPPVDEHGHFLPSLLRRLRPTLRKDLSDTVQELLNSDPRSRPSAASVIERLEASRSREQEDLTLERTLLAGGILGSSRKGSPLSGSPGKGIQAMFERRSHWKRRLEGILESLPLTPSDTPVRERVERALRFCRAMRLCNRFLPLMPLARRRLERAQKRLPPFLQSLPGEAQKLRQGMELEKARHMVRLSLDLCETLSTLNLGGREAPQLIESTGFALQSALKRLDAEERRHRSLLQSFEDNVAKLDIKGARKTLVELQELFSGANRNTARVRDRLHRLVWLLERLVCGREGLDEAIELMASDGEGFERLFDFVFSAVDALGSISGEDHRSLSIITRVFDELSEGYPSLDVRDAQQELYEMRTILTQRVVALLETMEQRLAADPVPLRPLLRDLLEVDRILLLDCLVDCEGMNRTQLLDRLEQLRMRVEEVSARFRRLAAGAREQVQLGRLTTALYDLERALKSNPSEEDLDSGASLDLKEEIEQVRKLREDIRNATRRNLELAELYARLREEEDSELQDKLSCLDQREQVLTFLFEKGPSSFRSRYLLYLRELRQMRLEELAEDAEKHYLSCSSPERQRAIAGEFLDRIARSIASPEDSEGSKLRTLRNRWTSYHERARQDLVAAEAVQEKRFRRTRLIRRLATAAGATALVTLAFLFGPKLLGGESSPAHFAAELSSVGSSREANRLLETMDPLSPHKHRLGLLVDAMALAEKHREAPEASDLRRLGAKLRRLEELLPAADADPVYAAFRKQIERICGR